MRSSSLGRELARWVETGCNQMYSQKNALTGLMRVVNSYQCWETAYA